MSFDEFYASLKTNPDVMATAESLTGHTISRNLFPMTLIQFYSGKDVDGDDLTKDYAKLLNIVLDGLRDVDVDATKVADSNLKQALWHAKDKADQLDLGLLAKWLIVLLLSAFMPRIDANVKHLKDTTLLDELKINFDDEYLVDISAPDFELRKHGLVVSQNKLIYPHQFLRRYYSANFVDILEILSHCIKNGLKVSVRLDPLRSYTEPRFYQNIFEADYWHGAPFDESLLMKTDKKEQVTFHRTVDFDFTGYPVAFTIFRSSMMDDGLRQFTIEEFTPRLDPSYKDKNTPGFGDIYCIQKFAHFVFDQTKKTITHVDGAVRSFKLDEYELAYQTVMKGSDPGSKIGKRHKLFLIEGSLNLELTKDILYEFFRYNPHLQEYFAPTS